MKKYAYLLLLPAGVLLMILGLSQQAPALSAALIGAGSIVSGLSAALAAPLLARRDSETKESEIAWRDERNAMIREKAAWYAGLVLIAATSVGAFALVLADQLVGACALAGLLLLYSLSLVAASSYLGRKL